ncbi:MAG: polyprenyl synthetase family protein [Nocardioidaceae bacterium]
MNKAAPRAPVVGSATLDERLEQALVRFVAKQRERLAEAGPAVTPLIDAAHACVSGGKRLRAAYCYWGWRAAGGAPDEPAVVEVAAALEWLQSSALVHDDLIDSSATRRGRPSVHEAFATRHVHHGWRGDARAHGAGVAILVGDLMLSWADEMFRSCGLPPDTLALASPYLDLCKSEVVAGQFLDMVAQAADDPSVDTAMRVVRFKAAKYTVERPLHVGAALAGADQALLASLSAVGVPVGEAFQLRDDVLGMFGDSAVTGKPAGDDLREGKRTVLLARAYERADDSERALLDRVLGNPTAGPEAVTQARAVIVRTGALAAVEEQIERLHTTARTALDAAPIADPAVCRALEGLAERSVRRSR